MPPFMPAPFPSFSARPKLGEGEQFSHEWQNEQLATLNQLQAVPLKMFQYMGAMFFDGVARAQGQEAQNSSTLNPPANPG